LAHLAKALVYYHYRESACALRELGRCVELNELCTTVHAASALLMVLMGSHQQGLRLMDETRRKASHLPGYFYAAYSLYYLHEVGDAKRALGYAERLDLPNAFWTDLLSAACLSRLGSTAEARSFASRVAAADPIFAKRPEKRLSEIFYSENLSEFLAATLSDAGLGPPPSSKRNPPAYRVSLKQRSLPSEIRVGILHSLSGTMALSESHLVNAALLAIEEINQSGGVLGRPVRGLVKDGASDAHTFGRCARKLVEQDGVTSIFGCWTSSSRKAVLPVVEQEDALLWYPLQYEGLEKSKHIIYTGSCLNQQIEPAVRWALKRQRRNCYLIGSDYVFPRTANRLIRALVESGGGQVMGEGYQQLGRADFEAVAQDIRRLKPEIVYNTVNGAENVSLMQALARAGVHPKDTPVMSFSLSELELAQCGSLAQGHLACWSYFQSLDTPKNRELVLRFRQRYGQAEVLSDPAVTAYSQVHLWRKVVESARSLETKEVLAHLTGCTLELGDEMCEMLPNHHVTRRAVIGEIQDGQFRVVWSSAQPIAPQPWLGVDQGEFFSRDLILGALQALPEMAERSSVLSQQIDGRALDATGRNA
jgi:urea ABC transporter urea binding protein